MPDDGELPSVTPVIHQVSLVIPQLLLNTGLGGVIRLLQLLLPLSVTVILAGQVMAGDGFTVTVAVMGVPVQPFTVGVMVKVTVTGEALVLLTTALILPAPLAAIPVTVAVLSLVQLYTVAGTLPLKAIGVMALPLQTVCDDGVATASGVGFTVMVKLTGVPLQLTPLVYTGVTVIVAVTGVLVALVAVKLAMLPVPLAARPMDGSLLVQL